MRFFAFAFALGTALTPIAASAACDPQFVDTSNVVILEPTASFDDQRLIERFEIRLRNDGDEACTLRLGVSQAPASGGRDFPAFSLTGPTGNLIVTRVSGGPDGATVGNEIVIPANGQVAVPYDVRIAVGWGSPAGRYAKELTFQLFGNPSRSLIASRTVLLDLTIPMAARIRFAGASGVDGPARIEMGEISTKGPTRSPPFALRVLSTSAYKLDLVSENNGALRKIGGTGTIPYELTLRGKPMNLGGSTGSVQMGRHTSPVGDVHPVKITISPDPTYGAGEYSDRVTVTVTTI